MKSALLAKLFHLYSLKWLITRPVLLGVRTLLVQDKQVLLVKHSYQDGWLLPGGGVKRGEMLDQAARRESYEESGAQVGKLELFGVYSRFTNYMSDHIMVFLSEDFTASFTHDFEIESVQMFPLDALPGDMMDGHRRRVEEYIRGELRPRYGNW